MFSFGPKLSAAELFVKSGSSTGPLPAASAAIGISGRWFFPFDGGRQANRLRRIPGIHDRYTRSVILNGTPFPASGYRTVTNVAVYANYLPTQALRNPAKIDVCRRFSDLAGCG